MKLTEIFTTKKQKQMQAVARTGNQDLEPEDLDSIREKKRKAARGTDTNILNVAQRYKKNIKVVLDKDLFFFRNSDTHHEPKVDGKYPLQWMEQVKRTKDRESQYAQDGVLMRWVDSTWKDYPKRTRSFFSTQSLTHADRFGPARQILMIIPEDSVSQFAYTEKDFNLSDADHQTYAHAIATFYRDARRTMRVGLSDADKISQWVKSNAFDLDDDVAEINVLKMIRGVDIILDNLPKIEKLAVRSVGDWDKRFIQMAHALKSEMREHGFATAEEMMKSITPEKHGSGVKLFKNFAALPKEYGREDEMWFEGNYLAFYWHGADDLQTGLRELYRDLSR